MSRIFGALAIFLSVIFLHFVWIRPLNFPLTLAPFAIILFLMAAFRWKDYFSSPAAIYITIGIFALPWVGALQLGFEGANGIQFARTYALWVTAALSISAACFMPIRSRVDLAAPSVVALIAITICVVLQAITSQAGDKTFFNFFGAHQYFGEIELETLATEDRLRPPGFYLEPSFCAYVITNLTAICLIQNQYRAASVILGSIAILFIQSLTGLLAFATVLFVYAMARQNKNEAASRSTIFGVLGAIPFVALTWYFYADYVSDRTAQIDEVGSSTYYRIAGLLPVLADTLTDFPFGYALGRVREVVPKYMIPHGTGYGESIDNGLYLIIFYFGWPGLLSILALILNLFRLWAIQAYTYAFCTIVILLGCFFNGGIMLPEFALLTIFLIYASRSSRIA